MSIAVSKQIPKYVRKVANRLISKGFDAYLVGGSVRDLLLNRDPKDYDIATSATPTEVEGLFPKSVSTGAKFGTIIVIIEDNYGERFDVEVTTFRSESDYYSGRWPSKVEFTTDIRCDLSRRDFTINAIAIDLSDLESKQDLLDSSIIDPFGGQIDLENRLIRAVGDPAERFAEDGLRTIRACRFASTLGFRIDDGTLSAMKRSTNVTKMVAIERVRDELNKIIFQSVKPSKGLLLLEEIGLLSHYIPELLENKAALQPKYHTNNAYVHSLKTMDIAEDEIKWAALLHDIGKIKTRVVDKNGIHYYGHDVVGAEVAREVLLRLKFSRVEIATITNLVRWHMFYYPSADWRRMHDLSDDEKGKNIHGWSDGAVRRFIRSVGGEDVVEDLIKLRIADANSNEKSHFNPIEISMLQKRIAQVISDDMVLTVDALNISGKDLINMGYTPGPLFSEILDTLLSLVIEDPRVNSKDTLKKIVTSKFPLV